MTGKNITLTNRSELTAHIEKHQITSGKAFRVGGVKGYTLEVTINDITHVLSTFLSDHPKVFKRADALLDESMKMGLKEVRVLL